ncbi:MAG: hypothetical protein ACK2T0_05455 [Anaerolineales bacterium]
MLTTFGLVCGPVGIDVLDLNVDYEGLRSLAKLTLAGAVHSHCWSTCR